MPHWLPARCVQGLQRSLRGQFARRPGRDTFLLRGSSVVADQAGSTSATPTDKMALIRRDDTLRSRLGLRRLIGTIGPTRITWLLDRGRGLARGIS